MVFPAEELLTELKTHCSHKKTSGGPEKVFLFSLPRKRAPDKAEKLFFPAKGLLTELKSSTKEILAELKRCFSRNWARDGAEKVFFPVKERLTELKKLFSCLCKINAVNQCNLSLSSRSLYLSAFLDLALVPYTWEISKSAPEDTYPNKEQNKNSSRF